MIMDKIDFAKAKSRRDFLVDLTMAVASRRVNTSDLPKIVTSAIDFGLDLGHLAARCEVDLNTVMDWGDADKPGKPDDESSLAIAKAILDQMMPLRQVTDK